MATAAKHKMVTAVFRYRFFFFQAEDGIRDRTVTGVQTCALPISEKLTDVPEKQHLRSRPFWAYVRSFSGRITVCAEEIGRASCRERAELGEAGVVWHSIGRQQPQKRLERPTIATTPSATQFGVHA